MNRGYIAGCCVIVAAAGLGYWIFSDKLPMHRPPPPALSATPETGLNSQSDQLETYAARRGAEIIDLAGAYDPTGDELDLHNLLHGRPVAELAPLPRPADPEIAPLPREAERELLHQPRIVLADYREAGAEASSQGQSFVVHEPFASCLACLLADWLSRSLPLKGINEMIGSPRE